MAKSTNNHRLYLDFNATSPLAPPVREYLAKGDFLFGNPASLHSTGKRSKRAIHEVRDYLYQTFALSEDDFHLFFHSGATEGINNFVKGLAHLPLHFICLESDHSCVYEQKNFLERENRRFSALKVLNDGTPNLDDLWRVLKTADQELVLLNLTLSNNETGVVLPTGLIERIKERAPHCFIHLDAVQGPGKIEGLNSFTQSVDAMTLSCHKFGSLKGVGFTFMRKTLPYKAPIVGGDQQDSLRAGTENPDGIWSIKLALEWTLAQDQKRLRQVRDNLEQRIVSELKEQVSIAGAAALNRNANTSYIIVRGVKADILLTAFDLAGMDVSTGSACRSGSVSPSRVLLSMGYNESDAKSAVRISLGHQLSNDELESIADRALTVFHRFRKK